MLFQTHDENFNFWISNFTKFQFFNFRLQYSNFLNFQWKVFHISQYTRFRVLCMKNQNTCKIFSYCEPTLFYVQNILVYCFFLTFDSFLLCWTIELHQLSLATCSKCFHWNSKQILFIEYHIVAVFTIVHRW